MIWKFFFLIISPKQLENEFMCQLTENQNSDFAKQDLNPHRDRDWKWQAPFHNKRVDLSLQEKHKCVNYTEAPL